jgi:hypothetical protein
MYIVLYELLLRMRESYMNPSELKQIKKFEISGLKNRIHNTNLLKNGLRIKSAIRIFKVRIHESGFASPKLKDSKGFGFANLYF